MKVSFAGALKEMLSVLLRVPVEKFEDRDFKENVFIDFNDLSFHKREDLKRYQILSDSKFSRKIKEGTIDVRANLLSVRQLLQYWGTQICRFYLGENIWTLATLKSVENQNIIISDLRFKNEASAVQRNNGIVVYIDRPGHIPGSHQSEIECFEMYEKNQVDFVIHNDGSLKDLFNKIKKLRTQLLEF